MKTNALIKLQTERSFQKQPTVFLNRKKGIGVKRSRKPLRYHKDVGLGFKTPREVTHDVWKLTCLFFRRQRKRFRSRLRSSSTRRGGWRGKTCGILRMSVLDLRLRVRCGTFSYGRWDPGLQRWWLLRCFVSCAMDYTYLLCIQFDKTVTAFPCVDNLYFLMNLLNNHLFIFLKRYYVNFNCQFLKYY